MAKFNYRHCCHSYSRGATLQLHTTSVFFLCKKLVAPHWNQQLFGQYIKHSDGDTQLIKVAKFNGTNLCQSVGKKKVVEVVAKALSLLQPESKTSQSETAVTVTSKNQTLWALIKAVFVKSPSPRKNIEENDSGLFL